MSRNPKRSRMNQGSRANQASSSNQPAPIPVDDIVGRLNERDKEYYVTKVMECSPTLEKKVSEIMVGGLPGISQLFQRNWRRFLQFDGDFDRRAVQEWYATAIYDDARDEIIARVRNCEVRVTKQSLIDLYEFGMDPYPNPEFADGFDEFLHDPNRVPLMEASLLMAGHHFQGDKTYPYLTTRAKVINYVICSRILPTKSPRKCTMDRMTLTYCIEQGFPVDVARLMFGGLKSMVISRDLKSLVYPVTITKLCELAGVPIDKSEPLGKSWFFKPSDVGHTHGYDHERSMVRRTQDDVEANDEPTDEMGFRANVNLLVRQMREFMTEQREHNARVEKYMEDHP